MTWDKGEYVRLRTIPRGPWYVGLITKATGQIILIQYHQTFGEYCMPMVSSIDLRFNNTQYLKKAYQNPARNQYVSECLKN